jgi:AraC-like DNA-binding protein
MVHLLPGVEQDSRGILRPWDLAEMASLNRYPPGDELTGLIDRFWATSWNLPDGVVHDQQVLTHPCANLVIATAPGQVKDESPYQLQAVLNGVFKRLTQRRLAGTGWSVAAMTTPGGLGALITVEAAGFTNRMAPLTICLPDSDALTEKIAGRPEADRVELLRAALVGAVQTADPARVTAAREVAGIARLAETDRSLLTTAHLSKTVGVGSRTLQRMFRAYVGVSPSWVLRRYRLLEAAELARAGSVPSWANIAGQLGYSDQAHLIRDFRAATGMTPASYAAAAG